MVIFFLIMIPSAAASSSCGYGGEDTKLPRLVAYSETGQGAAVNQEEGENESTSSSVGGGGNDSTTQKGWIIAMIGLVSCAIVVGSVGVAIVVVTRTHAIVHEVCGVPLEEPPNTTTLKCARSPVPTEIGLMTSLTTFSCLDTSGWLPSEIGSLTALTGLNILLSGMSGPIPTEIGLMTAMQMLSLESTILTGFPSEIALLTNLEDWYMGVNYNLKGTLPSEIGKMTSLRSLHLWSNDITGAIPTEFGMCSNMTLLHLKYPCSDFFENGPIPTEIGLLTSLTTLHLERANLGETIPSELGALTRMTSLFVASENLAGSIPSEIGLLAGVTSLWLSHGLTGVIPSEMSLMSNLHDEFYLGGNLTGTIATDVYPSDRNIDCTKEMCPYTCHCACDS